MTKQEKIIEAYGEYYKKCNPNENGWIDYDIWFKHIGHKIDYDYSNNQMSTRPKSLSGIENNNGWNSFNYEELPKNMDCHVINPQGDIVVLSTNVINSISKNSLANISHYKIIEKPKPPVY